MTACRPPKAFGRTIEKLKDVGHTISFNVPTTFAMLVEHMRKDADLRRAYFSNLDLIFYAGASLPRRRGRRWNRWRWPKAAGCR